MKSKASKSQLKRAAKSLLKHLGYIAEDTYKHDAWPDILKELIKEESLHHSVRLGRVVFVAEQ